MTQISWTEAADWLRMQVAAELRCRSVEGMRIPVVDQAEVDARIEAFNPRWLAAANRVATNPEPQLDLGAWTTLYGMPTVQRESPEDLSIWIRSNYEITDKSNSDITLEQHLDVASRRIPQGTSPYFAVLAERLRDFHNPNSDDSYSHALDGSIIQRLNKDGCIELVNQLALESQRTGNEKLLIALAQLQTLGEWLSPADKYEVQEHLAYQVAAVAILHNRSSTDSMLWKLFDKKAFQNRCNQRVVDIVLAAGLPGQLLRMNVDSLFSRLGMITAGWVRSSIMEFAPKYGVVPGATASQSGGRLGGVRQGVQRLAAQAQRHREENVQGEAGDAAEDALRAQERERLAARDAADRAGMREVPRPVIEEAPCCSMSHWLSSCCTSISNCLSGICSCFQNLFEDLCSCLKKLCCCS